MKKFALAILAANLLFVSCKKDEKEADQSPSIKASDYFPMSVGNYWVYEIFEIDTLGNEVNTGWFDSVYVAEKEMINREIFYRMKGATNLCYNMSIRDSLGYLINSEGTILFAPDDFSDTLAVDVEMLNETDTLYVGYSKMEKVHGKVSLQAGSFDALLCRNRYYIPLQGVEQHRELLEYRAAGVGLLIKQCGSILNPTISEGRLVRYSVN